MKANLAIISQHIIYEDVKKHFLKRDVKCIAPANSGKTWFVKGHDGIIAYYRLADYIHNDKSVFSSFTFQEVCRELSQDIIIMASNNSSNIKTLLNNVKKRLKSKKVQNYYVYRNIWGITLSKSYRKLDCFVFQKRKNALRTITKGQRKNCILEDLDKSEYVVRCTVKSATSARALELADQHFENLEYFFAFLIGTKNSGYEIRVNRQTKGINVSYITKSDDGRVSFGAGWKNITYQQIDLNNDFFYKNQIKRIFTFIVLNPKESSSIDFRIQRAILWIGKGLLSNSSVISIINYTTSLESLLIINKKLVVSPSIIASLSEMCAFLLGRNTPKRIEIANLVQTIYSARSAGTHGGVINVNQKEEYSALELSINLVYEYLYLYPRRIKSEEEMLKHIKQLKYK